MQNRLVSSILFGFICSLIVSGCGDSESYESNHERMEASGEILAFTSANTDRSKEPTLVLVATLVPPRIGDEKLMATDIYLSANKGLVSYNMRSAVQAGALDLIDLKKETKPKILSEVVFKDNDANAVTADSSFKNAYVVGASQSKEQASLFRIKINNDKLSSEYESFSLESFAGTDITLTSDRVYSTSGDKGGLSIFSIDKMSLLKYVNFSDARSVGLSTDKKTAYVLQGQPGRVQKLSALGDRQAAYEVGGNNIAESKSTIAVGQTTSIMSLGDGGWKMICNEDGSELTSVKAVSVKGLESSTAVTNAASAGTGMVYIANGEAGVYIYSIKEKSGTGRCKSITTNFVGSLSLGEGFSANHIYYKNGYLFVASGLGGFKIIRVNKSESDDDCKDFSANEKDD